MGKKIIAIASDKRFITLLFFLLVLTAVLQSLFLGPKIYHEGGLEYTHYNNYKIFKHSFLHLKNYQDLYILHPQEHWDLYKYSPSFSVFFGLFASLPDWLGLFLWNFLNAFILLFAVYYLPKITERQKGLILLFCAIELMTAIQNQQSNGLIAGLTILAFGLLERNKYRFATLCIVFSAFIKLFGLVGFALFLFYPKKWKLALYSVLWTILLLALPLIFIDFEQYKFLFTSWQNMLANDYSSSYGYSVTGVLHSWSGMEINKMAVLVTGIIMFLIPLARFKQYSNFSFRLLVLTSVLIWVVIFNHKAESPTFIIAMAGVSIWFVISEKNALNIILFIMAFILTSVSRTDIFPRYLNDNFVIPYSLKAFPCILIWLKIVYDMIVLKRNFIENRTGVVEKPLTA